MYIHSFHLWLALTVCWGHHHASSAFAPVNIGKMHAGHIRKAERSTSALSAAPARLPENVDGVLYVNEKCINCAACSHFAPTVFSRSPSDNAHVVHNQPSVTDEVEIDQARAALSACPVAAIRVENSASLNHKNLPKLNPDEEDLAKKLAINPKLNGMDLPFPRPLLPERDTGVYFIGHHNEKSFGATPYLVRGLSHTGETVSVLVDTPKFTPSAVRTVLSLTGPNGPDYLFLTHVDDTAHHDLWHNEFPNLKRIFHDGDLGRHNWVGDLSLKDVEVLLKGKATDSGTMKAWNLDGEEVSFPLKKGGTAEKWPLNEGDGGDFIVLHTPGHSPGSICLLFRGKPTGEDGTESPTGIIFTGDTYAYSTRDGGGMSGFPRYGNDLTLQAKSLEKIVDLSGLWDVVAAGHGHHRDYTGVNDKREREELKVKEMEGATDVLVGYRRRWR